MLAAEALGQGLEIDGCRPTVRNVHNEAAAVPLQQSQPSGPPAAPTPSPRPQPALQGAAAAPAHGASQQQPSAAQQQAQQQRPQQRQQHEAADAMPWLLAGSLATAQQQDQFRGSRSSSASSLQSTTAGQLQRLPSLPGMAGLTGQPPAAGYPAATWGVASPSEPATSTDALYARPLACVEVCGGVAKTRGLAGSASVGLDPVPVPSQSSLLPVNSLSPLLCACVLQAGSGRSNAA